MLLRTRAPESVLSAVAVITALLAPGPQRNEARLLPMLPQITYAEEPAEQVALPDFVLPPVEPQAIQADVQAVPEQESISSQSSDIVGNASFSSVEEVHQAPAQEVIVDAFPAFDHASFPVSRVPNWGAMTKPEQWNRSYAEMTDEDFVAVPAYDLSVLTIPMEELQKDRMGNIPQITAKLFYSTRFMGTYDLDAGEYTGSHDGVDLKLAPGTPVGAIGGGRVTAVLTDDMYGNHVIIEHRIGDQVFHSLYGHLQRSALGVGDDVAPGQTVGYVGMTGNASAPHLHLQVDDDHPVNPMTFIQEHRRAQ